ncbi:hypothetical protein [uncultured Treponema sp.]|nr:hypothetical protein [uncultured Treponema sp.]
MKKGRRFFAERQIQLKTYDLFAVGVILADLKSFCNMMNVM